jgi:hypothetical protein
LCFESRAYISSIVIDPFPGSLEPGIFLVQIFCESPRCGLEQANKNNPEHAGNEVQRFLNVEPASSCCVLLNSAGLCRGSARKMVGAVGIEPTTSPV